MKLELFSTQGQGSVRILAWDTDKSGPIGIKIDGKLIDEKKIERLKSKKWSRSKRLGSV